MTCWIPQDNKADGHCDFYSPGPSACYFAFFFLRAITGHGGVVNEDIIGKPRLPAEQRGLAVHIARSEFNIAEN